MRNQPLLVLLLKANAAKLDDKSLYDVVEDLPGNETNDKDNGGFTTCLDIMARNGQISFIFIQPSFILTDLNSAGLNFSSFWQGALRHTVFTPYILKKSGNI